MISLVFWTAVAVCAVAQAFIVLGAIRARSPAGEDPTLPRSSRAVEIGWTIVPAIGLALLLIVTHRAVFGAGENDGSTPSSAVVAP